MGNLAQGLSLTHPVFNYPRKVDIKWEEMASKSHYIGYKSPNLPETVGAKMKVTRVQSSDTVSGNKNNYSPAPIIIDLGITEDVPGLEFISGGFCASSLTSIAIGRQGRFLYWCFTSDPSDMTETGKDMFINAVYYIYSKRNTPTVPYMCPTRRIIINYLEDAEKQPQRRDVYLKAIPTMLVPQTAKDWTHSLEFNKKWIEENADYLYPAKLNSESGFMDIDNDAKTLKTPNNKIESLQQWITLTKGNDTEKKRMALSCLDRYVASEIKPKDNDWSRWFDKMKSRIVFVDTAGFKWLENPTILEKESLSK
jgi:hypothetical protein